MSSIINASVSSNGIVSTADASGRIFLQSNGTTTNALAWGTFYNPSGTTVTINNSYNISSITASAAGDFTVNFTTAMANANYIICGTGGATSTAMHTFTNPQGTTANTTTAFRVQALYVNGGLNSPGYLQFAIFGN